jgi:hypothetical protein
LSFLVLLLATACIREEEMDNTPQGNFEALWKMIDERYCFFDYKQNEYGLDWNEVRDRYAPLITPDMPRKGLFEVLGRMLAELRDGHVNLYANYDVARYWKWYEDYPANFSEDILRNYLGTDYKIAGGLKYTILDDNIAYVYYASFSSGITFRSTTNCRLLMVEPSLRAMKATFLLPRLLRTQPITVISLSEACICKACLISTLFICMI